MKKASKDGFSSLGLGAAACVACCAGPILAFFGGLGIAGLASTLLIGTLGLLISAAAIAAVVVVRRRACEASIHPSPKGGLMKSIPVYDATAPITCTIGSDEIPERIELVERMRHNLQRIERTKHGMLLHFPNRADIDGDLRRFAVDEKRCCQFWGFAVDTDGDALTLRWDGPPDVEDMIDQLLAHFGGDQPMTSIGGLL